MRTIFILLIMVALAAGCKKAQGDDTSDRVPVRISTQYTNANDQEGAVIPDEVKSLTLYVCQKGKVVWLERFSDKSLGSPYVKGEFSEEGNLYVIANELLVANTTDVIVGSDEAAIEGLYTSHLNDTGLQETIAMGGKLDLATLAGSSVLDLLLERNMGRFDIVSDHSAITPLSVKVTGLPMDGRVISSDKGAISATKHDISRTFASPVAGGTVEGAFYCHAFAATDGFAPMIEISSLYGTIPVKSYLSLAKVARNTFYRIMLREASGQVEAALVVVGGMEPGDNTVVSPNESVYDKIDLLNSTKDALVEFSADGYRVTFPASGGVATIAMTGATAKNYMGMVGTSTHFTITPEGAKFKLTVTPNNRSESTHESVILNFAKTGETDPSKFARVTVVMLNRSPISIVTMAGLEWMTVNAQGPNPASYPEVSNTSADIRALFTANSGKWGGVGEQWGPRAGKNGNGNIIRYEPGFWTYETTHVGKNGPVVGDATLWDKHDYCPEGWRAPLREEFARIWPTAGMQVDAVNPGPFTYTTTKGEFSVTYEKIGQNSLVISDGVNELIFPLMGMRSASIHYHPSQYAQWARDVGTNVYYWSADRDVNTNPTVFGYVSTQIYNYWMDKLPYMVNNQVMTGAHWSLDSFCTTRCVKELEK